MIADFFGIVRPIQTARRGAIYSDLAHAPHDGSGVVDFNYLPVCLAADQGVAIAKTAGKTRSIKNCRNGVENGDRQGDAATSVFTMKLAYLRVLMSLNA